ncbi:hypothetical protein H0H81_012772 [Sphagnurus paluster]|uniref:Uncharacterized protein n=1 Tax=Sphagnurus paluster TaxID=117069 RepID=A0A9P7FN05_9AGAR|nr:hypothetical protein H0H81_012772 [Sphagnurus paluster]
MLAHILVVVEYSRTPCDPEGYDIGETSLRPQQEPHDPLDYSPFPNCAAFELSEFLFVKAEMSAGKVDQLLNLLSNLYLDDPPPFIDHKHMYSLINSIKQGEVAWESFSVSYTGECPSTGPTPPWMLQKFKVWFQDPLQVLKNQISNLDFENQMDFAPKHLFNNGKH